MSEKTQVDSGQLRILEDVTVERDEFSGDVILSVSAVDGFTTVEGETLRDAIKTLADHSDILTLDISCDVVVRIGNDWGVGASICEAFIRCLSNATGSHIFEETMPYVIHDLVTMYENTHGELHVQYDGSEYVGETDVDVYRELLYHL